MVSKKGSQEMSLASQKARGRMSGQSWRRRTARGVAKGKTDAEEDSRSSRDQHRLRLVSFHSWGGRSGLDKRWFR